MSHKHEQVLRSLFAHPVSMNIKWADVVGMFEHLGGEVEVVHGGREKVRLNGHEHTFHIPHSKSIESKDEIVQIKHFLEQCGIQPG